MGNLYEGNFNQAGLIDGFCVVFSGKYNEIEIGWYKNDQPNGNHMKVNAENMNIKA